MDKAKQLVNLLIQPMVSFWYHNWEKQELHSGEEMLEARKSAYENVQVFLNMLSLQTLPIQLILDSEFTYFVNGLRNSVVYYIGMFHQRYRECLMGEPIVEWNKLKVPIDAWEEFQSHCERNKYKYLDMNF